MIQQGRGLAAIGRARKAVVGALVTTLVAVPVALAVTPRHAEPGQRIDLKVLLVADSPSDSWTDNLQREGIPFDVVVASPTTHALTDDKLADYNANRAKYQAVIVDTAISADDDAALAKLESTFGIRRLSPYVYPNPAHGLDVPFQSGPQDGTTATLTAAGRGVFPYLQGDVRIADEDKGVDEAWGYQAKPAAGEDFRTLLQGPGGSSYLGIHTLADGREEMVMTVASNATQSHAQLLRHGMINWVTRGVYLGMQRNYLELHVDDLFLGDDSWDPVTKTTNYDPGAAIRMNAADLDQAAAWSKATGLRLDMAFNGDGAEQYKAATGGSDPLLSAAQRHRSDFRWINHTWDHTNLDCSTRPFIADEIVRNAGWAKTNLGAVANPQELITGEHSGLANSRPGNPGTIDPPQFDDLEATTGGKLPVGRYVYAVAALSPHGETSASQATATVARGQSAVRVTWPTVCHSTGYRLYRAVAGTSTWRLIKELAASPTEATDTGTRSPDGTIPATVKTYTDQGAAGASAAPKTTNTAALDPYAQNPKLIGGLTDAGVRSLASDASKAYPDPAGAGAHPAGESFVDGPARIVPRHPTNVYYNTGTREQQLDEYNWLYVKPSAGGGCADIPGVTTCRGTPATWQDYVAAESAIMFGHVVGNDPRPHYFHQSNLAEWDPAKAADDLAQGGVLYPVVDALKARYDAAFNATMPLVQLTQAEVGDELARRERWAKALAAGSVTAYLLDGVVHVTTTATLDVPLTGATVGTTYGGQKSGWRTVAANTDVVLKPSDPAAGTVAPSVSGTAQVGGTLTANAGTWTGTGPITYAYRWQRCDATGAACQTLPGAEGPSLTPTVADKGSRLRVVVFASNAVSAVSQATSAPSAVVKDAGA